MSCFFFFRWLYFGQMKIATSRRTKVARPSLNHYNKAELNDIRATFHKLITAKNDKIPGSKDALIHYADERNAIVAEAEHVITILHHSISNVLFAQPLFSPEQC